MRLDAPSGRPLSRPIASRLRPSRAGLRQPPELFVRVLVGGVAVPMGFCVVVMGRRRVFLGLFVAAMAVVMRCLPMMMGSRLVVAGRGMVMFGSRMAYMRGHLFLLMPVGHRKAAAPRRGHA